MRLRAVKSGQCATAANKYFCPEVFLDVVADKLTSTAVLFLNVELLSEFHYHVSPISPVLDPSIVSFNVTHSTATPPSPQRASHPGSRTSISLTHSPTHLEQFPRELDARLGRHLSDADFERFAREDPKVRRHLDLIRRKELLELALDKMESLKRLDTLERRSGAGGRGGEGGSRLSSSSSSSSSSQHGKGQAGEMKRGQRWGIF